MNEMTRVIDTSLMQKAHAPHLIHDGPAFSGNAPPGLGIGDAGERVHDRVEVRRDMQAHVLEIVTGVNQHRQTLAQQMGEACGQLGTADAASEREDPKACHYSLRSRPPRASAKITNSESGLRGLSFPGRAGYPSGEQAVVRRRGVGQIQHCARELASKPRSIGHRHLPVQSLSQYRSDPSAAWSA